MMAYKEVMRNQTFSHMNALLLAAVILHAFVMNSEFKGLSMFLKWHSFWMPVIVTMSSTFRISYFWCRLIFSSTVIKMCCFWNGIYMDACNWDSWYDMSFFFLIFIILVHWLKGALIFTYFIQLLGVASCLASLTFSLGLLARDTMSLILHLSCSIKF